jgi:ankyrin repeat protein
MTDFVKPLPRMLFSQAGGRGEVEVLLRHGADAAIRNNRGETAADLARKAGFTDIAELIDQESLRKRSD